MEDSEVGDSIFNDKLYSLKKYCTEPTQFLQVHEKTQIHLGWHEQTTCLALRIAVEGEQVRCDSLGVWKAIVSVLKGSRKIEKWEETPTEPSYGHSWLCCLSGVCSSIGDVDQLNRTHFNTVSLM